MSSRKAIILIIVLGCIIYANSLSGRFIWDDEVLVKDNLYIRSWHNLGRLFTEDIWAGGGTAYGDYYRPLHIASYVIDYSLWGLNTAGYHLISILLHILAALCVFRLVCLLFGDKLLSVLAAVLFVSHPIQTETVASISIRGDILSTLFILLTFIFYIMDVDEGTYQKGTLCNPMLRKVGWQSVPFWYVPIVYILALLSKENSLILPFLILLYHYVFGKKIRFGKFAPLLIVALAYVLLRTTLLGSAPLHTYTIAGMLDRVPGFFAAITNYLRILILPFDLHAEYGEKLFSFADPKALTGIVISFLLILYAFKNRKANPLVSFSILWFFIALLPVSNIYPIGFYMAEHYLYLPSIGFFSVLAYGLTGGLRTERLRTLSITAITCLVIFYSVLTIMQTNYWKEPVAFYERTLKYSPDSPRINNNLGNLYGDKGDHEKAIQSYKKAIQIDPGYVDAYFNLGKAYDAVGMRKESIKSFVRAIELNPGHWSAYNELGLICSKAGKNEEAIELFKKAIGANPRYAQSYINLGMMYNKTGKKEDAVKSYETAIKLNPYIEDSYYNLANLYLKYGEKEKAVQFYLKAIAMNKKDADAYNNLGVIYRDAGDMEEAVKLFGKAIEAKPDNALAYHNLAVTYSGMKRPDLAVKYYDKAKELGFIARESESKENK